MEQVETFSTTRSARFRRVARPRATADDLTRLLLLPAIVTACLWLMSTQQISVLQAACSWLLLCFPWGAYLSWKRQRRYEVSLFAFVSAMYWLFFGVALFLGNRYITVVWAGERDLSQEAITQAMLMAVLGVGCLWAGIKTPTGRTLVPNCIPDIPSDPSRWNYIRVILALGTLFSLFPGAVYILGEGGRQLIVGLQNSVPLVAFVILFRHYLKGGASQLDKALLAAYFFSKFAIGVSSGWLGTIVFVALACFIVYLTEKRRPPWLAMMPLLLYIVFFQAGKPEFRRETWYEGSGQQGIFERMERWASLSLQAWQDALDDSSGEKRVALLQGVIMRTSLLTQTAHVIEQTPSRVPYQLGGTYSYLAATWIPRAFWPDKPSASEANRFYQVAYGLTTEKNLESVSFAAGAMTEGYINFGWLGVAGVMYGLGLLMNWIQKVFLVHDSGLLLGAMGIMLVTRLITIEAQLAIYISGLAQQMLLVLLVFYPVFRWRKIQIRSPQKLLSKAVRSSSMRQQ